MDAPVFLLFFLDAGAPDVPEVVAVDWRVDWLVGWSVDWLAGWIVDWLRGWMVEWPDSSPSSSSSLGTSKGVSHLASGSDFCLIY